MWFDPSHTHERHLRPLKHTSVPVLTVTLRTFKIQMGGNKASQKRRRRGWGGGLCGEVTLCDSLLRVTNASRDTLCKKELRSLDWSQWATVSRGWVGAGVGGHNVRRNALHYGTSCTRRPATSGTIRGKTLL